MVDRSTITKTMKKFQITDANNTPIAITKLDEEAAAFWNKEVHPKNYANPFPDVIVSKDASFKEKMQAEMANARNSSLNWYEIIGWNIANQGDYNSGWQNVVHTMMAESLGDCLLNINQGEPIKIAHFVEHDNNQLHLEDSYEERIYATLNYFKPFVDLINHWMSKGYIPKKIEG